ncbi:hypothetical protein GBA52_008109 [Prunus armeniaca]|nr:hypothetical protein GBA52_008109 [Prunus armeniaca]
MVSQHHFVYLQEPYNPEVIVEKYPDEATSWLSNLPPRALPACLNRHHPFLVPFLIFPFILFLLIMFSSIPQ